MPPVATKRIRNLKSAAAAAAAAAMQNQNSRLAEAGDETRHQLQHSNRKIRMAHLINGSLVQPNQPPGSDLMRSGMQIHIYNDIDRTHRPSISPRCCCCCWGSCTASRQKPHATAACLQLMQRIHSKLIDELRCEDSIVPAKLTQSSSSIIYRCVTYAYTVSKSTHTQTHTHITAVASGLWKL